MIADPGRAPRRDDLGWLRHRAPASRPAAPAPTASPPSTAQPGLRQDLPWLRHRSRPRRPTPAPAPPPAPPRSTLDLTPPRRKQQAAATPPAPPSGGGLDLTPPRRKQQAAASPPAPPAGGGLDLTPPRRQQPEPTPAAASSTSLDLSSPATPATDDHPEARPAPAKRSTIGEIRRSDPNGVTQLTADAPTVTLTRRQSGIGTLLIEAACSAEVGDLRLGCVYELANGTTSVVGGRGGQGRAPADSERPVFVASKEQYPQLEIDLRQVRSINRFLVYACAGDAPVHWGGTLRVTTFGGAVTETTISVGWETTGTEIFVLLTAYNPAGELILRAEHDLIPAALRPAAEAYGYGRVAWLDDNSPLS